MPIYQTKREIVNAVQFDPEVKPWPPGVRLEDKDCPCCGDDEFTFGESSQRSERDDLYPGDFIETDGGWRLWCEYDFLEEFEIVPTPAELAKVFGDALSAAMKSDLEERMPSKRTDDRTTRLMEHEARRVSELKLAAEISDKERTT